MTSFCYIETCPVGCQGILQASGITLPEGELLRCHDCGQLVSQCSENEYWASMQEFDDPQGTLPVVGSVDRRYRQEARRLANIARHLEMPPADIHLLDVGCSSGAFLRIAKAEGFIHAEGVEPAPQAAQSAVDAGLKVTCGLLHEAKFPDAAFDAVTLFEVIEHLKEPAVLLKECHRILRPGGVMLIGTGNTASWTVAAQQGRWEYFQIAGHGGHISFFNPTSLKILAERCGFQTEEVRTRNVRLIEKGDAPKLTYKLAKVGGELLNQPARWLGKGHDMLVLLRRPLES
jgi:SAM-dependent methyltransferase